MAKGRMEVGCEYWEESQNMKTRKINTRDIVLHLSVSYVLVTEKHVQLLMPRSKCDEKY